MQLKVVIVLGICLSLNVHTYTLLHTYMCTIAYIHVYYCIHTCVLLHTYMCTIAYIHVYYCIHTCVLLHTYMCTIAYIHTYVWLSALCALVSCYLYCTYEVGSCTVESEVCAYVEGLAGCTTALSCRG